MNPPPDRPLGFATIAIHGRRRLEKHEPAPAVHSVAAPIYQSSTFAFESAEQGARIFEGTEDGYVYTRLGNPTQAILENEMAFLEGGEAALAVGSGMFAAVAAILTLAKAGERVVAADTLYGGTYQLLKQSMPRLGIECDFVDATDPRNLAAAIRPTTRAAFIETPSNPTMKIVDIAACAEICRKAAIPLVVDNTFATPYYQKPLALGAEIVVHSATKYIGGHGDTVAGVLVGGADFMREARLRVLRDFGGVISPFNAWLLLRGLKTLPVRMDKHTDNALEVAQYLAFHPKVTAVHYPGLRTHPQHDLAMRQMRKPGGMIAIEVRGGREAGRKLLNSVRLWTLAVSLGDVDSLIEHPATMTHSTYSADELRAVGIAEGLIRLSVGLEDVEDLIEDLKQAFREV
jgi:methionine-gamma-lyase